MQVAAAASSVCAVAVLPMLLLVSPGAVAQLTPITDLKSAVTDWTVWTTNPTTATTKYGDISGWNVAAVTSMGRLFFGKPTFNADIGGWNVASVGNMYDMFWLATAFNQDISAWNTASTLKRGPASSITCIFPCVIVAIALSCLAGSSPLALRPVVELRFIKSNLRPCMHGGQWGRGIVDGDGRSRHALF
jgi:hypothetical protein